jgi:ribosomal protein S16
VKIMGFVERRVTYFIDAGKQNTDTVLNLVKEYIEAENIKDH